METLNAFIKNDLRIEGNTVIVGSKAAANIGWKEELDQFLSNKHVVIPTYSKPLYKLRKIKNSTIEIEELITRPDDEFFEYAEDTKTLTELTDKLEQTNDNGTRITVKTYRIEWGAMWAVHGTGLMADLSKAAFDGPNKITFVHGDKFSGANDDFMSAIN